MAASELFPTSISLLVPESIHVTNTFQNYWKEMMRIECHEHSIWRSPFIEQLKDANEEAFELAAIWSTNMIVGSFCFPRYVAALAARSELEVVRHGLLENAWDESGSYGHTARSHFWLAVRLAKLLGLTDGQISQVKPLPEALAYTNEHYSQCVRGDFGFALGMICLIEEFTTPEFELIFKTFLRTCEKELAMGPEDFILKGGAEYFTANISDDERHRQEMPRLVASWLYANGTNLEDRAHIEKTLESIRNGIKYSLELRKQFFDGIFRYVSQGGKYKDLIKV